MYYGFWKGMKYQLVQTFLNQLLFSTEHIQYVNIIIKLFRIAELQSSSLFYLMC